MEVDPLSTLGRDILRANAKHAYERLVVDRTPAEAHQLMDGVTYDKLFAVPIVSHASAATVLGALWLWHDGLDESHFTFQQSPEKLRALPDKGALNVLPAGSGGGNAADLQKVMKQEEETLAFWHAIMHRREGDFSNSKYWFDRCARHPILPVILAQVQPIVGPMPADKTILKLTMNGWNPHAFVDLVERVYDKPSDPYHRLAVSVQQLEWRLLFDHCIRAATGQGAGVQFFTPQNHQ